MKISATRIAHNLHEINKKYYNIITILLREKKHFIPQSMIDSRKIQTILYQMIDQFLRDPNTLFTLGSHYASQTYVLIINTAMRFLGHNVDLLYEPNPKDRRFKDLKWEQSICHSLIKQLYLMFSEFVTKYIDNCKLDNNYKQYLRFILHQILNLLSPSNSIFFNPQILSISMNSNFDNIVQGLDKLIDDINSAQNIFNIPMVDKNAFILGQNIATSKGKVVLQNDLSQLICYDPLNLTYAIPILLIPPWINKYYILDLSCKNSLVKWLVNNNFQVFILSWINPDKNLSHKNFDDYFLEGIYESCLHIMNYGFKKINIAGYCMGGTLMAMSLAYMSKHMMNFINSASFFATLLDFSSPGELGTFIDNDFIDSIASEICETGYIDGRYLTNNFNLLRANDLIWSTFIKNYLLCETPAALDVLYWNSDSTHLPFKMYISLLRDMYLNNSLTIPNAFKICNTTIDLGLITCPAFFVGAHDDHITPWNAVYDSSKLLKSNRIFCLTESGHVNGIINPPLTSNKYNYRICNNMSLNYNEWLEHSVECKGSWWTYWKTWLVEHSCALQESIDYNKLDFIEYAPGSYVMRRI